MNIEQREKHIQRLRRSGLKGGKPINAYWQFRLRAEELCLENLKLTLKLKESAKAAESAAPNKELEDQNLKLKQANNRLVSLTQSLQYEIAQLKKENADHKRLIEGMRNHMKG